MVDRNVPNAYIKVMMIYKHVICWVCGISELNKGNRFSTIHKTIVEDAADTSKSW